MTTGTIIHKSTFPDIELFQGSITDFIRTGAYAEDDYKPCMIDAETGEQLTQKQILDCADQFRSLLYQHGVQKTPNRDERIGDVVIPFIDNNIYLPAIHYACLELGCCMNPASTQQTPLELSKQIRVTDPKVIIYQRKYRKTVMHAIDLVCYTNFPIVIEFETLLFLRNSVPPPPKKAKFHITSTEQARKRIAYLGMSSGTSGKSKAVRLSHHNIVACSQVSQVTFPALYKASNVCVAVLPSCHVFGLYIFFMVLPRSGGTTIMHTKFDLKQLLESQKKYKANFLPLVPPIAVQLAKNPLVKNYSESLKQVKLIMSAAAPLGAEVTQSLIKAVGPQVRVVQGYGMTETSPCVTLFDPADPHLHIKACGKLVPNCEVRIVADGVDQPAYSGSVSDVAKNKTDNLPVGEIWVRGPQVMDGYHKNKSATSEAFVEANDSAVCYNTKWLRTGDVGLVDSVGRFMIVDRTKEMIKSMSKQVAPAELEDMLLAHADVSDAAVIGVENEAKGTEQIRAFLVLKKGGDALEVKKWLDSKLPKYKQLHGGVVVIDQIPKSQAGKILRRVLRLRPDDVVLGIDSAKL